MIKRIAMALLCIMFAVPQTSCSPEPYTRTEFALGTVITVTAYKGGDFEKAADKAFDRLFEIESIMSAKLPESELSLVNSSAFYEETAVSEELYGLLKKGLEFSEYTEGAFDITLGRLADLWGIGTENERIPSEQEIASTRLLCGYENLILDDSKNTVRFSKDIKLDLGAIAKGYAADEMKRILEQNNITEAVLNLGGSITLIGDGGGKGYRVWITDPRSTRKLCGYLLLENTSAVTSGDYERYFIDETTGIRYHHIFDRSTGYPAESGTISVTVVAESAVIADILSTACFVSGTDRFTDSAESAVFIYENGEKYVTEGLNNYFE